MTEVEKTHLDLAQQFGVAGASAIDAHIRVMLAERDKAESADDAAALRARVAELEMELSFARVRIEELERHALVVVRDRRAAIDRAEKAEAALAKLTAEQPTPPTAEKRDGYYMKFTVTRNDGRYGPGEKHHGCQYFVIDEKHDPHAGAALRAYADACEKMLPQLAQDLRSRHPEPNTPPEPDLLPLWTRVRCDAANARNGWNHVDACDQARITGIDARAHDATYALSTEDGTYLGWYPRHAVHALPSDDDGLRARVEALAESDERSAGRLQAALGAKGSASSCKVETEENHE